MRAILALLAFLASCSVAIAETHPMLSEVLFNVPVGEEGDANLDGRRNAAGDEFFELTNPHDEPIDLRGYVFANRLLFREGSELRAVLFKFPAMRLGPGERAVVFNGYKSDIPGPVGTSERPPGARNEHFGGAWVFTMGNGSRFRAMNNTGDYVLLLTSRKKVVDSLMWGTPDQDLPEGVSTPQKVIEDPGGSVTRSAPDEPFAPHRSVDGTRFSPGIRVEEPDG